jgi:hypothetical protein
MAPIIILIVKDFFTQVNYSSAVAGFDGVDGFLNQRGNFSKI